MPPMDLRQLILLLRARRVRVLQIFLACAALGLLLALFLPKRYTASVVLVIDAKAANNLLAANPSSTVTPGYLATQVDILTSRRVADGAAALPALAEDPVLQREWKDDTGGETPFAPWLGARVQRKLEVSPVRDSGTVTLSYTCAEAERCARVANAVADSYIGVNLEMKVEPARQYAGWFDERTRHIRETLEQAQRRLSDYQRQKGLVATDERMDVETARLAELSRQLVAVEAEHSASRSRRAESGSGETIPEVIQSSLIASLKAELAQREALRAQLAARYGANHPEMVKLAGEIGALQSRIGAETGRIVGSVRNIERVNATREAELRRAEAAQKAEVLRLKALRDEAAVLQRDVENAQKAYDLVTGRLSETSLESQAQSTNVFILVPATPPSAPSQPRRLPLLALFCVLGGLLGAGTVLVQELVCRRVRSAADLVGTLGLPVLGVIPRAPIPPGEPT
ncbi:MAG: chain length determinant protein EpsF [Zoogloeaceae bacterium]|nr:chain length determinant protein EpsF [Zoogloeaceae bacterium]